MNVLLVMEQVNVFHTLLLIPVQNVEEQDIKQNDMKKTQTEFNYHRNSSDCSCPDCYIKNLKLTETCSDSKTEPKKKTKEESNLKVA